MNFESRRTVLQLEFFLNGFSRQLAQLAHQDERKSEGVGQRAAENEPASFHAGDSGNSTVVKWLGQQPCRFRQRFRIGE